MFQLSKVFSVRKHPLTYKFVLCSNTDVPEICDKIFRVSVPAAACVVQLASGRMAVRIHSVCGKLFLCHQQTATQTMTCQKTIPSLQSPTFADHMLAVALSSYC